MKKHISLILLVSLLLITLLPTTIFAEDESPEDFLDGSKYDYLIDAPDLGPGDLLNAGCTSIYLSWGYNYDGAEIYIHRLNDIPEKLKRYDAIIVGDITEFTEYAITFSDGTVVNGTREIYPDGEHVYLIFPDKEFPPETVVEIYVGATSVSGTEDDYRFLSGTNGHTSTGGSSRSRSNPPDLYPPPSRPAPTKTGSIYDLLILSTDPNWPDTYEFNIPENYGIPPAPPAPPRPVPNFSDVPKTHWAYATISSAAQKGLMNGISSSIFDPSGTLSVAQIDQILYNAFGKDGKKRTTSIEVLDVPPDFWAYDAIYWSIAMGLHSQIIDYKYQPNDPCSRIHVVEALYRFAADKNITLPELVSATTFPDVSLHQTPKVSALQKAGIISGKPGGTFDPYGTITRAEMAKIIDLYTNVEGLSPIK